MTRMEAKVHAHDPYEGCEDRCGHELVSGVTIAELLEGDGPYPTAPLGVDSPRGRAVLLAGETMRPRMVAAAG